MDYSKYSDRELLLEILKRLDKQDEAIAKLKTRANRKTKKLQKTMQFVLIREIKELYKNHKILVIIYTDLLLNVFK